MLEVELVQQDGKTEIARHRIRGKKCLVGRHSMCQLQLDDLTLSKTHCVVIKHRNQVLITDLGSRTGTLVNEITLCLAETAVLQHGDRIRLGVCELVISIQDSATGEPAYCDPQYLDSLPYPFVQLQDRRGSQQDSSPTLAVPRLPKATNGAVVSSKTPSIPDANSTCTEETLRDLNTVHDVTLDSDGASDSIDGPQPEPAKPETEQEKQKRLQAVRLKIL
ncbi:MAG: FHA domain-containing protein, partial [Planctomycetota bacterium]